MASSTFCLPDVILRGLGIATAEYKDDPRMPWQNAATLVRGLLPNGTHGVVIRPTAVWTRAGYKAYPAVQSGTSFRLISLFQHINPVINPGLT